MVNEVLGDEQGDAEQVVVVLDTTDAQLIPVTRKLDAIKALGSLLHQVLHPFWPVMLMSRAASC